MYAHRLANATLPKRFRRFRLSVCNSLFAVIHIVNGSVEVAA